MDHKANSTTSSGHTRVSDEWQSAGQSAGETQQVRGMRQTAHSESLTEKKRDVSNGDAEETHRTEKPQ